jgi:hypothetical protein
MTLSLSWLRSGPYVQQWCAQGTVLRCTLVPVKGGYKRGGRGLQVPEVLIEASANIVEKAESVWVIAVRRPVSPAAGGLPLLL